MPSGPHWRPLPAQEGARSSNVNAPGPAAGPRPRPGQAGAGARSPRRTATCSRGTPPARHNALAPALTELLGGRRGPSSGPGHACSCACKPPRLTARRRGAPRSPPMLRLDSLATGGRPQGPSTLQGGNGSSACLTAQCFTGGSAQPQVQAAPPHQRRRRPCTSAQLWRWPTAGGCRSSARARSFTTNQGGCQHTPCCKGVKSGTARCRRRAGGGSAGSVNAGAASANGCVLQHVAQPSPPHQPHHTTPHHTSVGRCTDTCTQRGRRSTGDRGAPPAGAHLSRMECCVARSGACLAHLQHTCLPASLVRPAPASFGIPPLARLSSRGPPTPHCDHQQQPQRAYSAPPASLLRSWPRCGTPPFAYAAEPS